jgi:hypothetical protein
MEKMKFQNWRALLGEVGIIVLGVSIALAADQAVSWAHWRSEVATARQSLRAEIAVIDDFYAWRVAIAPCLERRLDQAQRHIGDLAANRPAGTVNIGVRGIGALLSDSAWQSEKSAQTVTHFPRDELALMGKFYAQMPEVVSWETKEADAWWGLAVFDKPEGLGPADLANLRLNLQIARHNGWLIRLIGREMLAVSDRLGIARPRVDPGRVKKFCDLSAADYVRYLDSEAPR